jgi:hypothetical protein
MHVLSSVFTPVFAPHFLHAQMSQTLSNFEEIVQFIKSFFGNPPKLAEVNTARAHLTSQYQIVVAQGHSLTGSEKDKNDTLKLAYGKGLAALDKMEERLVLRQTQLAHQQQHQPQMPQTLSNFAEINQFIISSLGNPPKLAEVNTVRAHLQDQYQIVVDQGHSLTGSEKDKNDKLKFDYGQGFATLHAIEENLVVRQNQLVQLHQQQQQQLYQQQQQQQHAAQQAHLAEAAIRNARPNGQQVYSDLLRAASTLTDCYALLDRFTSGEFSQSILGPQLEMRAIAELQKRIKDLNEQADPLLRWTALLTNTFPAMPKAIAARLGSAIIESGYTISIADLQQMAASADIADLQWLMNISGLTRPEIDALIVIMRPPAGDPEGWTDGVFPKPD